MNSLLLYFSEYLLLNVPEGILITLLAFSGVSFKENVRKYIGAILCTSSVIYIIPEIFPVIGLAQLYMIFCFIVIFRIGYDLKISKIMTVALVYFFVIFSIELFAMNFTMKYMTLQEYFDLSTFKRVLILIPIRLTEFILVFSILKYNLLELIMVKKGTFFGKSSKRKRG